MIALIGGLFLISMTPSLLAETGTLYEVHVPVADESVATRAKGLRDAMLVLLIRLTGDRRQLKSSQTQEFLNAVDRYVLRYRYETLPTVHQPAKMQLELAVSFNQPALERRLREKGIPIWGRQRPAVLLWLVVHDPNDSAIPQWLGQGSAGHNALIHSLDKQASARGIELFYPLLDVEDAERLRVSDVRGRFIEPILQSSRRYATDIVLYGSLQPVQATRWQLHWSALSTATGQPVLDWRKQNDHPTILLASGIDALVDELAAWYLPREEFKQGEERHLLTVTGVKTLDQYAAIQRYLEVLNSVIKVYPIHFDGDAVSFALYSAGDEAVIRQAISLGRQLRAIPGSPKLRYALNQAFHAEW